MAVHCPRCELRFRTEAELNSHLRIDHKVDTSQFERFGYSRGQSQKPLYPDLVEADEQRRRVLVVSNVTLRAERLHDHLAEMAASGDVEFFLVVPGEALDRVAEHEQSFTTVGTPALVGDSGRGSGALADHRLEEALSRLRSAGVEIEGMVGDADPVRAVGQALKRFDADEIVLSTLPRTTSQWLAIDVPVALRRTFKIPVTVVPAG